MGMSITKFVQVNKLAAFVRTQEGIYKIYDKETDWQIIGPGFERWCSKWADDERASLRRAASSIPQVDIDAVEYTNKEQ